MKQKYYHRNIEFFFFLLFVHLRNTIFIPLFFFFCMDMERKGNKIRLHARAMCLFMVNMFWPIKMESDMKTCTNTHVGW